MDKKELINEIAKYACNACEMGGDFDGDCHDLIGEYTTCGICQGTANKIYDDFICKYIEELNEKDIRICLAGLYPTAIPFSKPIYRAFSILRLFR